MSEPAIDWDEATPGRGVAILVRVDMDVLGNKTIEPRRGFATGVPGLVVWQQDNEDWSKFGMWSVTHVRSGLNLGWYANEPEQAMAFAAAVADLTDWTQSGADIVAALGVSCFAVDEAGRRMGLESCRNPVGPDYSDVW